MPQSTLVAMLGSMLGRFLAGTCASVIAAFSILLGAFGSPSEARALILFAWFVGFVSIAWVLLPAIRFGKITSLVAGLMWAACGVFASNFGVSHVRGYPLSLWVAASAVLLLFIVLRPPPYLGIRSQCIGSNDKSHSNDQTELPPSAPNKVDNSIYIRALEDNGFTVRSIGLEKWSVTKSEGKIVDHLHSSKELACYATYFMRGARNNA